MRCPRLTLHLLSIAQDKTRSVDKRIPVLHLVAHAIGQFPYDSFPQCICTRHQPESHAQTVYGGADLQALEALWEAVWQCKRGTFGMCWGHALRRQKPHPGASVPATASNPCWQSRSMARPNSTGERSLARPLQVWEAGPAAHLKGRRDPRLGTAGARAPRHAYLGDDSCAVRMTMGWSHRGQVPQHQGPTSTAPCILSRRYSPGRWTK